MFTEGLRTPRARMGALVTGLLACAGATGQVVVVSGQPQIGSSNPVTAAPAVPRPRTKPCVVRLFSELSFADYTPKAFSYAPPAGCPGPWAKVVFSADFTVSAGRQFDRTAAFYIGHANIYYGSTAEPRAALSPSWRVERDVTDLSAVLAAPHSGEANIGNFIGVYNNVTYDGVIYANAALEFYPSGPGVPAAHAPDVVVPVNGSSGDAGTLDTGASQITQSLNLPLNTERVYLDVVAQSQSNDEFWYFCVPNDEAQNLESCGNSAYRETEITIDGQPAGVAPVYPWIYTGGIDPYLWEPIPGIQTLDFRPYRVDLTPFAGVLADGSAHVIGISVFSADSYFLATANVLAYTDHGVAQVHGGIISNSLSAAPSPQIRENIKTDPGGPTYTGTITVSSHREFAIAGFVDTSHGRVLTTLEQTMEFGSTQEFDVNASTDVQNVQQTSNVDARVTTHSGPREDIEEAHFSYPLSIRYAYRVAADGSATQVTRIDQRDYVSRGGPWEPLYRLSEVVQAADTLSFDAGGNLTGNSASSTTASYDLSDGARCYSRTLSAQAQKLTSVTPGDNCRH